MTDQQKDPRNTLAEEASISESRGTMGSKGKGVPYNSLPLVVASIVAIIAWAVFILVYALNWSPSLSLFQNIVVTLVSLIITGLVIGLVWVIFAPRETWQK